MKLRKLTWLVPYSLLSGCIFGTFGFIFGFYFPWDDVALTKEFKWYSIFGRVLGMIVCPILFCIAGIVGGIIWPWLVPEEVYYD